MVPAQCLSFPGSICVGTDVDHSGRELVPVRERRRLLLDDRSGEILSYDTGLVQVTVAFLASAVLTVRHERDVRERSRPLGWFLSEFIITAHLRLIDTILRLVKQSVRAFHVPVSLAVLLRLQWLLPLLERLVHHDGR